MIIANHTTVFSQFAKGKKTVRSKGTNCVIYTRVSTKEQADNNMSLETQKKACESYATKNGFQIMGCFGGTYESAKTDERKHFNSMLTYVKKSKEKISTIIVYSVDRFSRSGGNAIYITEQLKREGISVFAVTQPTDTTTASGSLQQNIQFIFSEYDNQLRREKCMAGVKEKLLAGIWCTTQPMGYDIVKGDGKKAIILNAKGKLIKKAFLWKLQGLSNEAIRERLEVAGWKVNHQRITDFLSNPFYCGMIVHSALEGEVIEGIQEKAVTRDVFLQVNNILAQTTHGYSIKVENDDAPLKRFLRCDDCGKLLRAYKSKKIQKYYYKCCTMGCSCNKRADDLHERFKAVLEELTLKVNEDTAHLLVRKMVVRYNEANKDNAATKNELDRQLVDAEKKIVRLEERYIMEEIDREIFIRFKEKFVAERDELTKNLGNTSTGVSNLEKCLEATIAYALKLAPAWDFGDYADKQRIQNLVFPEGMYYNRKNDQCRTPRINSVFAYMAELARVSENKKTGNSTLESLVAGRVVWAGIEPATHGFSVHGKLVPNGLIWPEGIDFTAFTQIPFP